MRSCGAGVGVGVAVAASVVSAVAVWAGAGIRGLVRDPRRVERAGTGDAMARSCCLSGRSAGQLSAATTSGGGLRIAVWVWVRVG